LLFERPFTAAIASGWSGGRCLKEQILPGLPSFEHLPVVTNSKHTLFFFCRAAICISFCRFNFAAATSAAVPSG
jgi:hypothetical protein